MEAFITYCPYLLNYHSAPDNTVLLCISQQTLLSKEMDINCPDLVIPHYLHMPNGHAMPHKCAVQLIIIDTNR